MTGDPFGLDGLTVDDVRGRRGVKWSGAEGRLAAWVADMDFPIAPAIRSRLIEVVERRTSIIDAFSMADDVLRQGVQGITDLITVPGLINLDFADVRTIMQDAGASLMGIGTASGENRAAEAAKAAISSPLRSSSPPCSGRPVPPGCSTAS